MSKKTSDTWHIGSDNPEVVKAWQRPFDEDPAEEEQMADPKTDLTGGPGTPGFSKRVGRLNKLYANLTPEQRVNHPGYRRLIAVIELEQELNDGMQKNLLGYANQEEPAAPAAEPERYGPGKPQSTTYDKANQEEQTGVQRGLNSFIQRLDFSGGDE